MSDYLYLVHHPGCTSDYPERDPREAKIMLMQLDAHEFIVQCRDCGAHLVESDRGWVAWDVEMLKELTR